MKLVRSQKEGTNWHKSSPLSRWEGVLKRSGCLKHLDLDGRSRWIDRCLSFFVNLDIFVLILKHSVLGKVACTYRFLCLFLKPVLC